MGIEIGLRHSGYVESIVTIEEWVSGGRGGAEGGLKVIARRKPLERIVERAGEFREGRVGVYILSFISPGTPSKKLYVGVYGIVIMGE